MSDTANNTHVATAKFRQEGVHDWQADEGSTDATNIAAALDAQAEATLALVYEQRTANLIAVFGNMMDGEVDTFLGERIDGYELAKQIQERMGL